MTDDMQNRNYEIFHLRCNGWRLCDLARKFNLSSTRINHITQQVWRNECWNENHIKIRHAEFLPMFMGIANERH